LVMRMVIVAVGPMNFTQVLHRLIGIIYFDILGNGMRRGYIRYRLRVVPLKRLPGVFSRTVDVVGGHSK